MFLKRGGAPHCPALLRVARHARESHSTWPAGRAPGSRFAFGHCYADLNRIPAPAAWAPGRCPPAGCRRVGASLSGWGRQRQPAPPQPSINLASARCYSGGSGQRCPGPTLRPGPCCGSPYVARFLPSDCAPVGLPLIHGTACPDRASGRGLTAARTGHGGRFAPFAARVRRPSIANFPQTVQTARACGTLCAPSSGPWRAAVSVAP